MDNKNKQTRSGRQTSLETADQMFKDAFLIIKTRLAKQNPSKSDEEVTEMTAAYFRRLNEEKSP